MSVSGGSDLNDGDAYETFYNLRQMQNRKANRKQRRLESKDHSQVEAAGRSADTGGPSNAEEALPTKGGRGRPRKQLGGENEGDPAAEPNSKKRKRA